MTDNANSFNKFVIVCADPKRGLGILDFFYIFTLFHGFVQYTTYIIMTCIKYMLGT